MLVSEAESVLLARALSRVLVWRAVSCTCILWFSKGLILRKDGESFQPLSDPEPRGH